MALVLVLVLIIVGLLAVALFEQGRATAAVAVGTTATVAGQTANSVTVTVLAVLLVAVILASSVVVLYLLYRLRRAERRGQWLPGPNARWGRVGDMPQMFLPPWMHLPLSSPWREYPPPGGRLEAGEEEDDLDALPPWSEDWGW